MTAAPRAAAALALALAWAAPARALQPGAVANAVDPLGAMIEITHKAVVSGSDEAVYGSGHNLQALTEGGAVVYQPSLHHVEKAAVSGRGADVGDMLTESKRQLDLAGPQASAALRANHELQESLAAQKRVGVDRGLDDTEMGVYRFQKGRAADGTIGLNSWLSDIAKLVGPAFAEATLYHEAGHAGDAKIDQKGVIDGEIAAFQIQYAWLKLIDPTGEKLALLRVALEAQQKRFPGKLVDMAAAYAKTLDVLRGTGGDAGRIRTFAAELGYSEGTGKASVAPPSS